MLAVEKVACNSTSTRSPRISAGGRTAVAGICPYSIVRMPRVIFLPSTVADAVSVPPDLCAGGMIRNVAVRSWPARSKSMSSDAGERCQPAGGPSLTVATAFLTFDDSRTVTFGRGDIPKDPALMDKGDRHWRNNGKRPRTLAERRIHPVVEDRLCRLGRFPLDGHRRRQRDHRRVRERLQSRGASMRSAPSMSSHRQVPGFSSTFVQTGRSWPALQGPRGAHRSGSRCMSRAKAPSTLWRSSRVARPFTLSDSKGELPASSFPTGPSQRPAEPIPTSIWK